MLPGALLVLMVHAGMQVPAPAEVLVVHALTGEPLPAARLVTTGGDTVAADGAGVIRVDRGVGGRRVSATVEAPGFAPAPVAFQPGDRFRVTLLPERFELAGLVVDAVRGGESAPVTSSTLDRGDVESGWPGAEVPDVLAASPSVVTFSDAGVPLGYTYMRLRGMDQTRVAVSVDGVPLNEPEDQGVYFSNFPDFANSIASVQVQRGVGTSAFGAASYVGAVHVETVSPAAEPRGVETQLTAGSFGTTRGSVEAASGLGASRLAANARVSAHTTDGWRDHSGSESYSWLGRAGWYGDRDQVQVLALGGRSWNDMAYLATAESDLRERPTLNYLGESETDDFRQTLVSVAWSRRVSDRLTVTTRAYRTDLEGRYDVAIDGLWRFGVSSDWNGLLSYARVDAGRWSVDAGLHLSDYERDHTLRVPPESDAPVYRNVGHRDERSAFVRLRRETGPWTWTADAQLRRSGFRYAPDAWSGAALEPVSWTFFNPRVGVTWRPGGPRGWELYGFAGRTSREPTRNDLFAGFDDIGPAEAEFIGDLRAVRPETVWDVEAGARRSTAAWSVAANVFWMEFRDEIAPVGRLSYIGLPLRKNVERSARRGIELEWTAGRAAARVRGGGNMALMHARISRYVDDATGAEHLDVPPLLTPGAVGRAWVEASLPGVPGLRLRAEASGASRQHLGNDDDDRFVAPAWAVVHAGATWTVGGHEIALAVRNVLDDIVWTSGYHDGAEAHYYPMAGRTLLVTWRARMWGGGAP